jgi:hypothetical protein
MTSDNRKQVEKFRKAAGGDESEERFQGCSEDGGQASATGTSEAIKA